MAELFRRRTGCDTATDRHNWFVDPDACVVTESLTMFQTHRRPCSPTDSRPTCSTNWPVFQRVMNLCDPTTAYQLGQDMIEATADEGIAAEADRVRGSQ